MSRARLALPSFATGVGEKITFSLDTMTGLALLISVLWGPAR